MTAKENKVTSRDGGKALSSSTGVLTTEKKVKLSK